MAGLPFRVTGLARFRNGWSRTSLAARFFVAGALLMAVIWPVVLWDLRTQERNEALELRRQLESFAQIGAQAMLSSIRTTDLLLLDLRDEWRLDPVGFEALVRRRQREADLGGGFEITVLDAEGRLVYSTVHGARLGEDLGDRPHFRKLRDAGVDELVVGEPMRSRLGARTGEWMVSRARRLHTTDGSFGGVIVMSVSPDYLLRIFEPIEFGEGDSVSVFRDDGTLLLRASVRNGGTTGGAARLTVDHPADRSEQAIVASDFFAAAADTSYLRYRSGFDGIERVYANRPVGLYPLRLTIGRALGNIERAAQLLRQRYLLAGAGASLLGLAAVYWLLLTRFTRERALAQRTEDVARLERSEARLSASQRSLRELSSRQLALKEAERKRVAQEVHDELGQRLTVLRMELSMLARAVAADPARLLPERIEALKTDIDEALTITRDIAGRLRPATLDIGLALATEGLVEEFGACLEIPVELDNRLPESLELDEQRSTAAFRIVQEALTNAARHAGATHVLVRLEVEDDELCIRVIDDGRGFVAPTEGESGSLGLSGMRERAVALGGRIDIVSTPGQGSTIHACIPLTGPVPESALIPASHNPFDTVHSE